MISRENYLSILILIIMVFVMFMFVGVSSDILSDASTNSRAEDRAELNRKDTVTADSLNLEQLSSENQTGSTGGRPVSSTKLQAAIISAGEEDQTAGILVEWCTYNKYFYYLYNGLPKAEELEGYDLILFGETEITARDRELLYSYAELGTTMIFTRLPEYEELSTDSRFARFFGIREAKAREIMADGIKIFPDFLLSKERRYEKGDYFGEEDDTQIRVPYYLLAPGYEIYSVGLLENQKELGIEDKDLPPLLWRTQTGKSFLFSVNSEIYRGVSLLGVLTGFQSAGKEIHVYPVVNAQVISLLNYPYFSDENETGMQRLYSRSSEAVVRELLWPNIIQVLKNYGKSFSFFAAPQLDYQDETGPLKDYIGFYLKEISKLPGDMGLSLGQVSDTDLAELLEKQEEFFGEHLPEYAFTALYLADFDEDEAKEQLGRGLLKDVRLVMSDYREGNRLISFLNDTVLSVKFLLDGYRHETMDDLRMICLENALGMSSARVDIGRVIYPESSEDEWNNLSLKWSKGDTYYKEFAELDTVSIYEMEKRIRRFLALDYEYEMLGDELRISIGGFDEEAYFVLRTYSRSVTSLENASAEKLSDTAWLIKARAADVRIQLKEEKVLGKPGNNRIIPSNPEQGDADRK
ncbi:hypothetical protein HNQ56_000741 [Anaerotaenia torta]|uniref:DUF2194 domain-containing protein n=1 Tax=Anaerotaenia torta TaxID=433293 RepID=UPI003D1A5A40